jgi:hypothetical protein
MLSGAHIMSTLAISSAALAENTLGPLLARKNTLVSHVINNELWSTAPGSAVPCSMTVLCLRVQFPGAPLPAKPGRHSQMASSAGGALSVQVALPSQGAGTAPQASKSARQVQSTAQHCGQLHRWCCDWHMRCQGTAAAACLLVWYLLQLPRQQRCACPAFGLLRSWSQAHQVQHDWCACRQYLPHRGPGMAQPAGVHVATGPPTEGT